MDIVEFLTARLDERAELAQRVADRYVIPQDAYIVEEHPERAGQSFWPTPAAAAAIRQHPDAGIRAGLELIETYSPARVLAEVAAQRAILALHKYGGNARHPDTDSRIPICAVCESPPLYNTPPWPPEVFLDADGDASMWPCLTLRHLAAPYADHPDYDPAWAVA